MLSDLNMNKYFGDKTLVKIPFDSIQTELPKKISYLINNRPRINYYAKNLYNQAFKILKTWDERINIEKELIKKIK